MLTDKWRHHAVYIPVCALDENIETLHKM